jgi:hypothetical protein
MDLNGEYAAHRRALSGVERQFELHIQPCKLT